MRIRMTSGETELTATLLDNPTAPRLRSAPAAQAHLPGLCVHREDQLPPVKAVHRRCPARCIRPGRSHALRPWGNLAIFYRGGG